METMIPIVDPVLRPEGGFGDDEGEDTDVSTLVVRILSII
jgi:hypothetical protein